MAREEAYESSADDPRRLLYRQHRIVSRIARMRVARPVQRVEACSCRADQDRGIENGRYNIRVNIICPGSMDTPMNIDTAAGFNPNDTQAGLRALAASTVTGRVSDPK